jgi:hypothetical protein
MKKVLIYGTSTKAITELPAILINYKVLGFIDSDIKKNNQSLFDFPVFHYSELHKISCDLIIICSSFYDEIKSILESLNIKSFVNSSDIQVVQKTISDLLSYKRALKNIELKAIPQTPLLVSHIQSCQMLTNRIELLKMLPPNGTAAELGVATGSFSLDILKYALPKKLYLIDGWDSERYNLGLLNNIQQMLEENIQLGQICLKRKLSHEAVIEFPDHYFDWIYIDTTHSYEQTKLELELYATKIKSGGVIAGHDYCMGNWENSYKYGVIEAVHEFCVNHNYRLKYLTMDISETQSFAIEKIV